MTKTDDNALLHNKIRELEAELESVKKREEDIQGAVSYLITMIESAGLADLSRGIEIDPSAWFVEMNDAVNYAKSLIRAKYLQGEQSELKP